MSTRLLSDVSLSTVEIRLQKKRFRDLPRRRVNFLSRDAFFVRLSTIFLPFIELPVHDLSLAAKICPVAGSKEFCSTRIAKIFPRRLKPLRAISYRSIMESLLNFFFTFLPRFSPDFFYPRSTINRKLTSLNKFPSKFSFF